MLDIGNHEKKFTIWVITLVMAYCFLSAATASAATTRTFRGPTEAFEFMVNGLRKPDVRQEMREIFGEDTNEILGDIKSKKVNGGYEAFLDAYKSYHAVEVHDGAEAYLAVGRNLCVFPIPVVMRNGTWRFDMEKGMHELNARRIGRNERFAIRASQAYVEAQRDYFSMNPMKVEGSEYAHRIASTPGKHDGLYWASENDEENRSPLGEAFAMATVDNGEERAMESRKSHGGYRYKILHMQGPDAKGGARDYHEKDRMTGGFALLAYPSEYGKTGIMSFIVNQDGQVYEKDLGRETEREALAIMAFNPDKTWQPVRNADMMPGEKAAKK